MAAKFANRIELFQVFVVPKLEEDIIPELVKFLGETGHKGLNYVKVDGDRLEIELGHETFEVFMDNTYLVHNVETGRLDTKLAKELTQLREFQ